MKQTTDNECPICLTNKTDCLTICNHSYCVKCLSKTSNCALCRRPLLTYQICKELIENGCKTQNNKNTLQINGDFLIHELKRILINILILMGIVLLILIGCKNYFGNIG